MVPSLASSYLTQQQRLPRADPSFFPDMVLFLCTTKSHSWFSLLLYSGFFSCSYHYSLFGDLIRLQDFYFFFIIFFRAAPAAYGSSQATGRTGAAAASLCHSHSHNHTGSELHLQPTSQLMAMPDPQPTEQGQESNPKPHGS